MPLPASTCQQISSRSPQAFERQVADTPRRNLETRQDCARSLFAQRLNGTRVVFSPLVTTLRSTRNGEGLAAEQGQIVLVTVKQYLAVADDVLRKLFPELLPSLWADSAQYPACSVFIQEDECDSSLQ